MSQSDRDHPAPHRRAGIDRARGGAIRAGRQRNYRRTAGRGRSEPRQVRDSSGRTTGVAPSGGSPIRIHPKRPRWGRMAAFCRRLRELLPSKDTDASGQGSWYLVDRAPIITGRDLRSATAVPSTDNPGGYEVNFTLSTEAARRFGPFTEQNVGRPMAIVLDRKVVSAPVIQSRIEDSGRITGRFGAARSKRLGAWYCAPERFPRRSAIWRSARWGRRWERTRSGMECRPRLSACWWC